MNNNAALTGYHRKYRRIYLGTSVPVIDVLEGDIVGEVVNITIEGLMLALDTRLDASCIYQFILQLPEPIAGQTNISVGADCLWSSQAPTAGKYWAGFQIIDASEQAEQLITSLIAQHGVS